MIVKGTGVQGCQAGFSMVELMVALVLGLFLTTAILQIFVGSKQTYEYQQELSGIQQNGRFAMTFLSKDIRATDFWGCVDKSVSGSIASIVSGAVSSATYAAGLVGYNQVAAADTGYTASFGEQPDAILLQGARESGISVGKKPDGVNIHLTSTQGIKQGDILLISDCKQGAMFQVSDVVNSSDKIVHHKKNNGGSANVPPGNKTGKLDYPLDASATVYQAAAVRYWIRTGVSGEPALIRGTDTDPWTGGDELVEGVENLQFLYGEDIDGDGSANYFVDADQVVDMERVVSVQVHLVVRSLRDNLVTPADIHYFGAAEPASDGRMRKVFVSTLAIRNRLD